MMDFSGYNRGYAFVTFSCKEEANRAIKMLDNFEIRPGLKIGVCRSVDNCRCVVAYSISHWTTFRETSFES